MSDGKRQSASKGFGVVSIIQIILIIAKVFGFWNASWWIVLIPFWLQLGLWILIAAFFIGAWIVFKVKRW